jgi:hypothetical protein
VPLFATKFYIDKNWETVEIKGNCFERIMISTKFNYPEDDIDYNTDITVTIKMGMYNPASFFCTENLMFSTSFQDNYDIYF